MQIITCSIGACIGVYFPIIMGVILLYIIKRKRMKRAWKGVKNGRS